MMSGLFTKLEISQELSMGHAHLKYQRTTDNGHCPVAKAFLVSRANRSRPLFSSSKGMVLYFTANKPFPAALC